MISRSIKHSKVTKAALDATLNKLHSVNGASWDPRRVCLANTRSHIIKQVRSWVEDSSRSRDTNIFLLTGVAGAGKSTVAHTVAQHYAATKQLASSFFFNREVNDRKDPQHLISTIAADLCRTNDQLAEQIIAVIEQDGRVVSAPIARQFKELVVGPCGNFASESPLVIVLDGLDEGCNADLLWILCEVSRLPRHFCFFVTSRIFPGLEALRQKPHVYSITLDIHLQESIDDMAFVISDRLNQVAVHHGLGNDWPEADLIASFTDRSEGLPLWISTICDYLCTRSDPTAELQTLVSASHTSIMSAELKMDKLYSTILEACSWDDTAFLDDYYSIMGAVVACKTPLTLDALGSLFQRVPVISNLVCGQLSPLLTGLDNNTGTPPLVRFLHHSLRHFLTLRTWGSCVSLNYHKFAIDERAHSQRLAFLALKLINRELTSSMPRRGYISEGPGISNVSGHHLPEGLWYACRFWADHLLDVDVPLSPGMLKQLEEFLHVRLTWWMELMGTYGRYEGLLKLRGWVRVRVECMRKTGKNTDE